ncbi:hypothetical protein TIFTF001_037121 [Ficus carica]|uniref:Uncharacterized protein n=1 Tax=Ficus carica TaxID=3494 RepID=A0AA88J8J6_FICCA|nr:hypothetical protein TIFTF001_037121 [Ficus carica]
MKSQAPEPPFHVRHIVDPPPPPFATVYQAAESDMPAVKLGQAL